MSAAHISVELAPKGTTLGGIIGRMEPGTGIVDWWLSWATGGLSAFIWSFETVIISRLGFSLGSLMTS